MYISGYVRCLTTLAFYFALPSFTWRAKILYYVARKSQEEKYRLDAEAIFVLGETVSCITDKETQRNSVKDVG